MDLPHFTIGGHNWTFWLGWVWTLSSVIVTTWVILQRRSPVSTLAWIMVLNLMPVIGLAVYAYFGPQRVKRQRLRRWHSRAALMSQRDMHRLRTDRPDAPAWAVQHARLIEASCGIPPSSVQSVDILASGGATLEALLREVGAAEHHVHLEYYIFEPDQTGTLLLNALTAKARTGVEVRLLVDGIGSPALLSRKHRQLLDEFRAAGGELAVFHPARLDRLRPLVNLRTHRKIVVVDGRVGLLGGINVTDDENEHFRPHDAYRDTHLLLRGGAVRWLQYVFLQDWHYANGRPPRGEAEFLPDVAAGDLPVQIVASGPDTDGEAIHRAMIDALNMARQRIWLATPYFVPTEAALLALTNAALRGVQVKLIVPERSDSRVVTWAARSYYDELTRVGVQILEYGPRMLHAKTLVVDRHLAYIGTANFDFRSFMLNFEVNVALFNETANRDLAAMFESDSAQCTRVPRRRVLGLAARLTEANARLLSPLL